MRRCSLSPREICVKAQWGDAGGRLPSSCWFTAPTPFSVLQWCTMACVELEACFWKKEAGRVDCVSQSRRNTLKPCWATCYTLRPSVSGLFVGDASSQECGSLPPAALLSFPSRCSFHSHSREPSLEESGKHQQGMTGISAFHSPRPQPPPAPLNSGCLRAARLLSFLLFLNTAQQ